jgi:hypothetical protein
MLFNNGQSSSELSVSLSHFNILNYQKKYSLLKPWTACIPAEESAALRHRKD